MIPEAEKPPEPAIESIKSDTAIGVSLAQMKEEWTQAANDNRTVEFDGREQDPKELLKRVEMAESIIKRLVPSFDARKVEIEKLPEQAVGEAKGEIVKFDPWLIADAPIKAIVYTYFHEFLHAEGKVPDEAMVEAETRRRMKQAGLAVEGEKGLELTDEYISELQALYELISLIGKGKNVDRLVEEIYELCLNKGAEAVFELFDKEYISAKDPSTGKERTDAEKLAAFDLFEKAFPMMEVNRKGCFALQPAA